MSTIKLRCTDQVLTFENTPVIASGGLEEDFIEFDFCSQWDGFERTAVFWRTEAEVYHVILDENDSCQVPPEVTADDGTIFFGVFGVDPAGRQRTTEVLTYLIVKGAITTGTKPSEPTPDIYTQLIAKYDEMLAIAEDTRAKEQTFEEATTQRQDAFEEAMTQRQAAHEEAVTQQQAKFETTVETDQADFEKAMTDRQADHEAQILSMVTEIQIPDKTITAEKLAEDVLAADNVKVPYGTAAALGVFTTPNVEAALYQLNETGVPKIGDTVTTHRTDLGENWALCDGSAIESDLPFLTLEGFTGLETKNTSDLGLGITTSIQKIKKLSNGRFMWLSSVSYSDGSEVGSMYVTEEGSLLPSSACGKLTVQSVIHGGNFLNGKYIVVGRSTDYVSFVYGALKFSDTWPLKDNEATVVQFTDTSNPLVSITYDEQHEKYVAVDSDGNLYWFTELTDETRTKVNAGTEYWGLPRGSYQLDYINGQLFAYGSGGVYRQDENTTAWVNVAETTNAVNLLEYHNGYFYFCEAGVGISRTVDFSAIEAVPESRGMDILDFYGDRIVLTGRTNVLVMMDEADFGNLAKSDTTNNRAMYGTVSGDTLTTVGSIEYNGANGLYELTVCTANLKNRLLPTGPEDGAQVYLKIADDRLDNVPDFEVEPLPTHASTHAEGGSDPITPKMIGAATPTDIKKAKNEAKAYTDKKIASINGPAAGGLTGTATGETIEVHDSVVAPLHGLHLYGKTTQDVYDGGDLFDGEMVIGSADIVDGRLIDADGYAVRSADFIPVKGGSTIIISNDMDYYNMVFEYDENKNFINFNGGDRGSYVHTLNDETRYIIISSSYIMEIENDLSVQYSVRYDVDTYPENAGDKGGINVQINEQTFSVPTPDGLPGIPDDLDGNFTDENGQKWHCDEIDFARGVYVQRVGKAVLDSLFLGFQLSVDYRAVPPYDYVVLYDAKVSGESAKIFCSHFFQVDEDDIPTATTGFSTHTREYGDVQVRFYDVGELSDQADAGTPVVLWYPLAEPVETPLTEEQLAAYAAMQMGDLHTTITNDGGAGMSVEYLTESGQKSIEVIMQSLPSEVWTFTLADGTTVEKEVVVK